MRRSTLPSAFFLATVAVSGGAAQTALTAEQIQARLRAALGPIAGDQAPPEKQLTVVDAGPGAFTLTIPTVGAATAAGDPGTVGTLRPKDGGWALDGVHSSPRIEFDAPGVLPGQITHILSTHGEERSDGWYDPSLQRPSRWERTVKDTDSVTNGPSGHGRQHMAEARSTMLLARDAGGALDASLTFDAHDLTQRQDGAPERPSLDFSVPRLTGFMKARGIDPDRVVSLYGTLFQMMSPYNSSGDAGTANHAGPGTDFLARYLDLFTGVATAGDMEMHLEKLAFVANGNQVHVAQAGFGFGLAQRGNTLAASADLTADDVSVPGIGAALPFLPVHFHLHPRIDGVDAHAAARLVALAREPGAATSAQFGALLTAPGTRAAVDLAYETATSKLTGEGTVSVSAPGPKGIGATARIRAEHLDALIQAVQARAGTDKSAASVVPALIYVKGLGHPDGDDALVWDVVVENGRVLVNGVNPVPPVAPPPNTASPPPTP